ncbi:MAG: RNA-binding protein [Acidobacteria bacterium]|nr:RNA-binding protein [Acidobacteriota bacterium]MBV9477968.1 RNA-binding protein [Acidobacteriota bacterium]
MKLHIGNLSKEITQSQLADLVKPFGETTSVELAQDRDGASKGFGFAEYANDDHARAAVTGLDGKEFNGQPLKVSEARARKNGPTPTPPVAGN